MNISDQCKKINDYLNILYFEEVWNSIYMENRMNTKLISLNDAIQVGTIEFKYNALKLPDNDPYLTYYVPINLVKGVLFNIKKDRWICAIELIDSCKTHIIIYDEHGKVCPLNKVWIYIPTYSEKVIVILNKLTVYTCNMDYKNGFYITLFNDVNRVTPLEIEYVHIPSKKDKSYNQKVNEANSLIPKYKDLSRYTRIFVNGLNYRYDEFDYNLIKEDVHIELRCDKDVDIAFSVEVDENNTAYYSDMYKGYREIIHIPKALNPDNITYTHNVVTFYVRDIDHKRGVYYHRVQPTTVRNITHNDFSLDRDVLNAFKDALNATKICVDVCIRTPERVNHLVNDKFCIGYLYEDSDENIIAHLRGKIDKTLDFWKASQLEQSGYIQLMYHNKITDPDQSFDRYVKSFGVYNIGNIISKNHTKIKKYNGGKISVLKSFMLYGKVTKPFVFVNGVKLCEYMYSYDNYALHCNIYFTVEQCEKMLDQDIVVALYLDEPYQYKTVTPTQSQLTFPIMSDDVNVYRIDEISPPITNYQKCHGLTFDTKYVKENTSKYGINNKTLTFDKMDIGYSYFITNKYFNHYSYYDITKAINNYEPLIISTDIDVYDSNSNKIITPVLEYNTLKLFLNGYMLTPNIDYSVEPVTTDDNTKISTILHISNKNFLNLEKDSINELEIYSMSDITLSSDIGYQDAGYLRKESLPNNWYPGIDWCILEGKVLSDFLAYAIYIKTSDVVGNGKVYYLYMDWMDMLDPIFKEYSYEEEQNIQKSIVNYFRRTYPRTPDISKISKQHSLYSTYITKIIYDIKHEYIIPFLESSDEAFMQQFDAYKSMIEYDVTLNDNDYVDRLYVGVGGTYEEVPDLDETNTKIVRKLINLKLFPSKESVGETYL